ncbi:MAG: hypothetical protein ACT4QE_02295 [Anaerolineales bacterium]
MSLSDAQRAQVTAWLEQHQLVANCPMCADIAWEFTELLVGLSSQTGTIHSQISQPAHPMVQSVCTTCAHVRLLSARVMGLVP